MKDKNGWISQNTGDCIDVCPGSLIASFINGFGEG